ncbi:MAG: FAD:protein FMN transferase [Stagnimonas sp.]|nr:FAD:protein FMN transferase [Stagnimonas sp.]
MGSPCELRVWGCAAEVLTAARAELERLEAKYSRYRDDSLTTRINRSAGSAALALDAETAGLLDYAQQAWQQSGGRFDLSTGVLRRAWDFKSGKLPDPAVLATARACVGWQKLEWQRPRLRLPEGMELDFGGLVKEYAADRVAALLRERGARGGMVDLGGDIAVVGPQPDGSAWRIGIRDPRRREAALAVIELARGGLATSGDYERGMSIAGVRYSHLLDPLSGQPVRGAASVSVAAPLCLLAGTASTSAMLMGEGAEAWLRDLGLPWLLVGQDAELRGSLGPVHS